MSSVRPTGITANRQTRQLTIEWDDGHSSTYGFSLLRNACPCAECRGGHDKMGGIEARWFTLPEVEEPASRINKIEPVGSYAITIEWEDGHHYGIYNWSFLRLLCPCAACRSEAIDA